MALFNIRVYGILMNSNNQILVSDELVKGHKITKFPGGGLEFGEGTIECLKREFLEEANTKIEVLEHFYTTDFFIISAFNNKDQIISIYYKVKNIEPINRVVTTIPFNFANEQLECYRWINMKELEAESVTLPIDKVVVKMLLK